MVRRLLGLALLAAVILDAGAIAGCAGRAGDAGIAREIRARLSHRLPRARLPTVDDDDIQPLVRRFYQQRSGQPAWAHLDGPTADARDLLQEISEAADHGLDPHAYADTSLRRRVDALAHPLPIATAGNTEALASLDIALTRSFLKLAAHRSSGQVNPLQLPADWHIRPRARDLVSVLASAIDEHRVRTALDALDPTDPQYRALRRALVHLRQLEANGGWPSVSGGPALRLGGGGARVLALQRRLIAGGDLADGQASGRFDAATQAAVRSLQERFGLQPSGAVDAATLAAMDVPIGARIRQVELNLERRRWVPDSLLRGRYVEVNIPGYQLDLMDGSRRELTMRVVVGKQFTPTPMFSDRISYLVFNPTWNVPAKLARTEILPAVQQDPGYLRENGLRVYENEGRDAREIDPRDVSWGSLDSTSFRYALRADPGPKNPLGHVKFMCPNQFDVYLHDTPAGHLFDARERGFSHGCIRVEQPRPLAEALLSGKPGWDADRIAAAFDSSDDQSVTLPEPVPVHIVYWTTWVDDRGRLQFRDDVYGLDGLLDRVLRTRRPRITG